jgi:hypothetical protein
VDKGRFVALSATPGSRRSGSETRNAIAGSFASGSEPVYCSGDDVQQAINPENDHGLGYEVYRLAADELGRCCCNGFTSNQLLT